MKETAVEVSSPPTELGSAEGLMLKEADVRAALSRLERGEKVKAIARELGVDRKTIKRWRRVGGWYRQTRKRVRPIDRQGANLFFQLISRRYEKGAIILTSNQSLGSWGEVFGDSVIASAILDRLLHHSTTVTIRGDSYRLKEKLKAGLLKSKLTPETDAPEKNPA